MDDRQRKLVRAVVRRIHPDLFSTYPYACAKNSESLSVLNNYVEALSGNRAPDPGLVEFYVRDGDGLAKIQCELPAHGSLGPLFYAFGLISIEDLTSGVGSVRSDGDHKQVDFLEWLNKTVADASAQAAQHERMKSRIREEVARCEEAFGLLSLELGGEFALSTAEQVRQLDALQVVHSALTHVCEVRGDPTLVTGLVMRIYHPHSAPMDLPSTACVVDDGALHLVADPDRLRDALVSLDFSQARSLSRLNSYWQRRTRELTGPVRELLGVSHVWADSRTDSDLQRFVMWAGALLRDSDTFGQALRGTKFSFSVLVHTDTATSMVDYLPASSVLQIRADCPPRMLLEYLTSDSSSHASTRADEVMEMRAEEDALLEEARATLGAKHLIRVCTFADQGMVLDAAKRLIEAAPRIKATVDLRGASIAIDDCYEVWDSGFISIPYDFELSDLNEKLRLLLAPPEAAQGDRWDGVAESVSRDAMWSREGGYYPEPTTESSAWGAPQAVPGKRHAVHAGPPGGWGGAAGRRGAAWGASAPRTGRVRWHVALVQRAAVGRVRSAGMGGTVGVR